MPKVDVVDLKNKKIGTADLADSVYACKVNPALVHQVLVGQTATRRSGNAKTKTRSEVQGGGKKPYKQKGTGNARHGSLRSPIFVTGATTFGPVPRSYAARTPKKMVAGALRSLLSDRLKSERLVVVDGFKIEPKTKVLNGVLKNFKAKNVLIVDSENSALQRSAKNLPHTKALDEAALNVYDILQHDWLLMSKSAAQKIQDKLQVSTSRSRPDARSDA